MGPIDRSWESDSVRKLYRNPLHYAEFSSSIMDRLRPYMYEISDNTLLAQVNALLVAELKEVFDRRDYDCIGFHEGLVATEGTIRRSFDGTILYMLWKPLMQTVVQYAKQRRAVPKEAYPLGTMQNGAFEFWTYMSKNGFTFYAVDERGSRIVPSAEIGLTLALKDRCMVLGLAQEQDLMAATEAAGLVNQNRIESLRKFRKG